MRRDSFGVRAGLRSRTMLLAIAALATMAALASASSALAAPTGILAPFATCPVAVPGVELCTNAQTTSGEFKIGSTTVPINQLITLQGGAIPSGSGPYFLFPATDGNSLSKTELNVPGGITGLVNCTEIKGEGFFEKLARETCKAIFENKFTGVTATTELVANEHNPALLNLEAFLTTEGTAITLPVRVHLKNPLLGNSCFIGSETSPIQLHLTDGTTKPPLPNKPISGKFGEFVEEEETQAGELVLVASIRNNTLVDNAFSAPEAEGCGGALSGIINPIINKKIGLPSEAGHNTAILTGTTRIAAATEVAKHS
jgi:hypothetical protein